MPAPVTARPASPTGARPARWSAIGGRTVYFAHQSVGAEIVAGVEALTRAYNLPIHIVQNPEPISPTRPAFVHFFAGDRRDYASKNAAILRLLESPTRAPHPLVILKYCHGDIKGPGDGTAMFEAYRDTVDTIQFEHPDVTVVHATIPLTTIAENALKSGTKLFLGLPSEREVAVARHRYNELLRTEFGASEPIFDVARVQSTRPDGSIERFAFGGAFIETLAPQNTSDGYALAPACRTVAAAELLEVLADVIEGQS
jgi:hypothetical protein